jgi:hypothetical protein
MANIGILFQVKNFSGYFSLVKHLSHIYEVHKTRRVSVIIFASNLNFSIMPRIELLHVGVFLFVRGGSLFVIKLKADTLELNSQNSNYSACVLWC